MRVMLVFFVLTLACEAPGVGDPCRPEQVPPDGFRMAETYLETSSVQCRTRVCLVSGFEGDPTRSREECLAEGGADCNELPPESAIDDGVYCSCRCEAVPGSRTPTGECPSGFVCTEDLVNLGGEGIQGGYCVRATE